MTTAQDQQSRAAYEDGKWYWVEHEGWHDEPPTIAPALYKAECDAWYSIVFSGIPTRYLKVLEPCEMQAARALPAPENVREGEPYDNPAFEDLARTMGVWGTAQAALCAQFFLAGRGAQAAPAQLPKPVAEIYAGNLLWVSQGADAAPVTGDHDLFTATQVLAMGRVPPGWNVVPVELTTEMIQAGGHVNSEWLNDNAPIGEKRYALPMKGVYEAMLAAAPRPPAAQEPAP